MDYGLGKLDYGTQNFVKIGFSFLQKKSFGWQQPQDFFIFM